MRFLYVLFVFSLANTLAQAKKPSTCREPAVFKNFEMSRILGHWYEHSRHDIHFERGCDRLTTVLVGIDEISMEVKNCCQMTQVSNETRNCEVGLTKVTLVEPAAKEAYWRYTRVGSNVESFVWVIDTDYENYAIANGCDHVNDDEDQEIFWIFTREKEVQESERVKINAVLKAHNFNNEKIIKQNHGSDVRPPNKRYRKRFSSCREPVIFQNFNMSRVLGNWYQYSRHRHHFDEGCDCFTSDLVAIDETSMDVMNCCQMSSVSNDTQNCEIGINQVTLIDPEAKEASWSYTRVGSDVESRVWVIDTDYDNYAIANGCDHFSDEEEREIFYIFSREREIKEPEMKKINEVLRANNFERSKIIRHRQAADLCRTRRPPRRFRHHHRHHHRNRDNAKNEIK